MTARLSYVLFFATAGLSFAVWAGTLRDLPSGNLSAAVEQGQSCDCPDGYLPVDGGCCPSCYFQDPPCLVPCFLCGEKCGPTGDVCDDSRGLTCCGGSMVRCPAGEQSACSDFACAQ